MMQAYIFACVSVCTCVRCLRARTHTHTHVHTSLTHINSHLVHIHVCVSLPKDVHTTNAHAHKCTSCAHTRVCLTPKRRARYQRCVICRQSVCDQPSYKCAYNHQQRPYEVGGKFSVPNVCMYVCMCVCVCMYVCMYVSMCVCVCVYIYIYIYCWRS